MSVEKQRSPREPVSRRQFLRAAAVGGSATLGGCLSGSRSGSSGPVSVLAAGSLQHALETGLQPVLDVPIRIEAHGSATVARLLAQGQRDPDIVAVADTALFEAPLSVPWYAVFASNAVVLAYNPATEGGQRIDTAGTDRWYEPLLAGDVRLGRTDPEQDPLGYRTLFALELATRYYDDAPDLRATLPSRRQVYPETGLLSQFETGSIDAAFAYRNMALERGYDYVDLPAEIDLSDPRYAQNWYSTVAYDLPDGRRIEGGLIGYGATMRSRGRRVRSVFDALTTGPYLDGSGFLLREQFPRYEGDVPAAVETATGGD